MSRQLADGMATKSSAYADRLQANVRPTDDGKQAFVRRRGEEESVGGVDAGGGGFQTDEL